jgi:sugar phosphate isomerase/epimerase
MDMQIGMMNNPQTPMREEIQYLVEQQFDFIDFTLEPPFGLINEKEARNLKRHLSDNGKFALGHTAYYLPIDSPFRSLRDVVSEILCRQLDVFSELGTPKVTLHANFSYPHRMFPFSQKLELWGNALEKLVREAEKRNISLMLENVLNTRDSIKLLKALFRKFQPLEFLLDVGHANLNVPNNTVFDLLKHFKNRLQHVHLSDNFGRSDDLHLPLGAGGIPWKHILKQIKKTGYNETFTLEIFSRERQYLLVSRDYLRMVWDSV